MSDVWSEILFSAQFAGVPLDIQFTRDSIENGLVTHLRPRRDGANIQNMGQNPRTTDCRILFFERELEGNEIEPGSPNHHRRRFQKFFAFQARDRAQVFVHPLFGSYRARVKNLVVVAEADKRDLIEVTCQFIEDGDSLLLLAPGDNFSTHLGVSASLNLALEDSLPSTSIQDDLGVFDDVRSLLSDIEDPGGNLTVIAQKLSGVSNKLEQLTRQVRDVADLNNHFAWREFNRLHYEIRQAVDLAREFRPRTFQVTVFARPGIGLRLLAAQTYGAELALEMTERILQMNKVPDPSLIPFGQVLDAPIPPETIGRSGLSRF